MSMCLLKVLEAQKFRGPGRGARSKQKRVRDVARVVVDCNSTLKVGQLLVRQARPQGVPPHHSTLTAEYRNFAKGFGGACALQRSSPFYQNAAFEFNEKYVYESVGIQVMCDKWDLMLSVS